MGLRTPNLFINKTFTFYFSKTLLHKEWDPLEGMSFRIQCPKWRQKEIH